MLRKVHFYWALFKALVKRNQKKISTSIVLLVLLTFFLKILLPVITPKLLSVYKESRKPTFIEGVVGTPVYPNPLFDVTETAKDVSSQVFQGLTKVDSKGLLQPDLAESYQKISDTEYVFTLKKDVYWHDGVKFSSDDVVYTVGLTQESSYRGPLEANFKDVSVEKINDFQVKFKLKEPFSPFPYATAVGIIPKHISLKKYKPVGTGPFQVKKIDREKIVLTNERLNLVFQFFKSIDEAKTALKLGTIHALGGLSPQEVWGLERFGKTYSYTHVLPFREVIVFFNTRPPALAEKNIRQALAYALDKGSLRKQIGGEKAIPSQNQLSLGNWVNNSKERYPHSLEEAVKKIKAAGFDLVEGNWVKKGEKLTFTITNVDDPELNSISNFLKDIWIKFGVDVDTKIVSSENLRRKTISNHDFDVLVNFQEISPDPDQYVLWHTTQVQKSNITGISKSKLDKILEDARKSSDQKDRTEKYSLFTTLLSDEVPAIFLYYPQYTWLVSKKVTGIDFSDFALPRDRFNSFKNWKVERKIF